VRLLVGEGVGLEELSRAVFLELYRGLNDQIAEEQARWQQADQDLATELGRPFEPITIEPIAPRNWHLGIRETLVEAPVDWYPNVAVMAYEASDAGEDMQFDQVDWYRDAVFIEIMTKGEDEILVNRRTQRTADAAVKVLRRNRTLDGMCAPIPTRPRVVIGDIFPRRAEAGAGTTWWWQGARIDYQIDKPAA